jgi:hypothetical protein
VNEPAVRIDRGRTTAENVERWRRRVVRRMRAREPRRPPFVRMQFLKEFWADHPADPRASEYADAFEAAIAAADGNPARFEAELDRRLRL